MIIFIPVRLGSARLPNKVVADISGIPMMIRVAQRVKEADVAKVCFACAEQELVDMANEYGFDAILTDPNLQSGTDRVYAGYVESNATDEHVINVQGDMPFVDPEAIRAVATTMLNDTSYDLVTPITELNDAAMAEKTSTVKVVKDKNNRAIYFSRTPNFPYGSGPIYGHIGIYGYKADSMKRFVSLPRSYLEIRESLEQLRALEDGMTIKVVEVSHYPQSVDTPDDLLAARSVKV